MLVSRLVPHGTSFAISGNRAMHETRVDSAQLAVIDNLLIPRLRRKVFDKHVGHDCQLHESCPFGRNVEGNALFAPVPYHIDGLCAVDFIFRQLDTDYARAVVAQKHTGQSAGSVFGQVKYSYTV